ncbi:MAG: fluoride efflux transporter CrcB [Sedimentisphaerales bacterium]|nr:fluoride efflux transporter CrcB [Sedimentisphaerales bacterium]
MILQKLFWLALAGAFGTIARYGLAGLVHRLAGAGFPWGTLAVNVVGCFVAGLLWTLFEQRLPVAPDTRLLILVGFMGAFTTFSAYILETSHLFRSAAWGAALTHIVLQNLFGFVGLFAGFACARWS